MDTLKFTINRSEWLRGTPSSQSRLLREDGKMCCLGFAALASGYTEQDIIEVSSPQTLANKYRHDKAKGIIALLVTPMKYREDYYTSAEPCGEIMLTNDLTIDRPIETDMERECRLSWLFAEIDVEVTFDD